MIQTGNNIVCSICHYAQCGCQTMPNTGVLNQCPRCGGYNGIHNFLCKSVQNGCSPVDNRVEIWGYEDKIRALEDKVLKSLDVHYNGLEASMDGLEERLTLNEFSTQQCQNAGLNTDEELIRLTNLVDELRAQVVELSKELASIKANKINVTNE